MLLLRSDAYYVLGSSQKILRKNKYFQRKRGQGEVVLVVFSRRWEVVEERGSPEGKKARKSKKSLALSANSTLTSYQLFLGPMNDFTFFTAAKCDSLVNAWNKR